MDIIDFERTVNPEWWLKRLAQCDWTAGQLLHTLLKEGKFHNWVGDNARVLMLADGSRLVSFCTYGEKDDVPNTELTPWMGFVYTDPDYRGRRLAGKLIHRVQELARADGYGKIYISTGAAGLYEKYGAVFLDTARTKSGEESRIYSLNAWSFYGWEQAGDVHARSKDWPGIETPRDLYSALLEIWSRETCAPRMRDRWSEGNPTLGQCSVTAFLAQDLFGGLVYGVPLGDGNFHCFNVVGERWFDLTSEQFDDQKLDYSLRWEQLRHDHFQKQEKRERYEKLKASLALSLKKRKN